MNTGYNHIHFKDPKLARFVPTDFEHIDKHPLTAANIPKKAVPVVCGVNWYTGFYDPVKDKDGKWWVGKDPNNLGVLAGGHAICMKPKPLVDASGWWKFYDQGQEGACVGFASARMMSLLNRKRYDAHWLYKQSQFIDEWPGEDYEGTSVRGAMDVLRSIGLRYLNGQPDLSLGIEANKWATNMDDVLKALDSPEYTKLGAIPFLNSWGDDYPHLVWMPVETWARLMREDGEFTLITDRTN